MRHFISAVLAPCLFLLVTCSASTNSDENRQRLPFTTGFNDLCPLLHGKVYKCCADEKDALFGLKFICQNDTLSGVMLGATLEGEHGVFFYRSELKSVSIDDSLNISFSIVPGRLYDEVLTFDINEEGRSSSGVLRSEMFFKGRVLSDSILILGCFNEFNDCYSDELMRFRLSEN